MQVEKDTRESQARALKGLLKQAQAEAAVLKAKEKDYEALEKELETYKEGQPVDILTHAKEKRELEEAHSAAISALRAEYEQQIIETEKRLTHRMEEEITKVMQESQEELDQLAKVKEEELEIFKQSVERQRRRTSEFVSVAEHERLKMKLDELTADIEKENRQPAVNPTKGHTSTSVSERHLRQELADAKMELVRKQNAADKTKIELEKLRNQVQTSKSVTETKMNILKSKIKSLEAQLAKKNPTGNGVSTPSVDPSTPVAGGSGPGTRFQRAEARTVKTTVKGPPRFSTFSTTPYLNRTVKKSEAEAPAAPLVPSAAGTGSPSMRFSSATFAPRINTPRQSSPLRRVVTVEVSPTRKSSILRLSPRRMTSLGSRSDKEGIDNGEGSESTFTAVSKTTGKKISLFDDENTPEPANQSAAVPLTEEPRRRGKRKLNAAKIDMYDVQDADHPDSPGSVFKRVKLDSPLPAQETPSKRPRSEQVAPGTTTRAAAKARDAKGTDVFSRLSTTSTAAVSAVPSTPKATPRPSAVPVPGSSRILGRDISPLKDRNRGIRKTFKV